MADRDVGAPLTVMWAFPDRKWKYTFGHQNNEETAEKPKATLENVSSFYSFLLYLHILL